MPKGALKQEKDNSWWYYFPCGVRKQYYERVCPKCSKVDVVDKKHLNKQCKSCTLIGNVLSDNTKRKIANKAKDRKSSKETRIKMSISKKGENHPRFKGFVKDSKGYVRIYKPDHPSATKKGYVLEHRLVMESIIGRYLNKDEVVHHINGDKGDNRKNNLWLFDNNDDHMYLHNNIHLFTKKSNYVYLAGTISSDTRTYEWRENFEFLTREERLYRKLIPVNPCRNKFNQSMSKFKGSGNDFIKMAKTKSQQILRAKDKQLLSMCNLMLMDISIYDPNKPHIGTIQELTWAHDIFYMPIIAIIGDSRSVDNNPYAQHMWIDECCSAKVETVEEAVDLIKTFFLEY